MEAHTGVGKCCYFHYNWTFFLADTFPMAAALEAQRDGKGHFPYEMEYEEMGWDQVTLPHTFNDADLFRARIQDAGSGQKRTMAFYRKWFTVSPDSRLCKYFLTFEGIRQTCYLYVNGCLAGYYEAGVAPFGFDLTPWIRKNERNLIFVATDNTATRNIDFCIAETPNDPDAEPGSFLLAQEKSVAPEQTGVGYFWNCNDFNPSVGGITRPVMLHQKPSMYLTLPFYSNLRTKGAYIYTKDVDLAARQARLAVEAEIRNETDLPRQARIEVVLKAMDGQDVAVWWSELCEIEPHGTVIPDISIVPKDAYRKTKGENGVPEFKPAAEHEVKPTITESRAVRMVTAVSGKLPLRFWSIDDPWLYQVRVRLWEEDVCLDEVCITTGFPVISYDKDRGLLINKEPVWLRGYAQRASNEWAAIGIAPEWLKDMDVQLIRESNANHIRWMHVAASPADIRACDRGGIVCTQPAGDKEKENFDRQWDQRVELMRDVIIYFRNHPSIFFWEAGNNSISCEHMREMRLLKETLDPHRGRFMGCRTINTEEVLAESEYVGTMLNRHAARFLAEHGPVTETEYLREESPRRVWDDFSPPHFDYDNHYLGKGAKKQPGGDFYDLTAEEFALAAAKGYSEFFHDRIGGASGHNWYAACAALCWTDSAQHGRQAFSENGRMSGRVDPVRVKKQSFEVFRVMQSSVPAVKLLGHWNYPKEGGSNYQYDEKIFTGSFWEKTGRKQYRDPKHKTVYVIGSYHIATIELFINGISAGCCQSPADTFVFSFPDVDVTQSGCIRAVGYDYDGRSVARDQLETAGEPAQLRLSVHTSPKGLQADGADIAYLDVEVLDEEGRLCPLCQDRIDFETEGPAVFLGGYNSGRFEGFGRNDSVIHEKYVYAECGCNRVFIRSKCEPGSIFITARMGKLWTDAVIHSQAVDRCDEMLQALTAGSPVLPGEPAASQQAFPAISRADQAKYVPEDKQYCKILINGQEPDTRGVRSVNENGCIWGAVLCILERLVQTDSSLFSYRYDAQEKQLTVEAPGMRLTAKAGVTHLLVNGQENLMDGQPYIVEETGQFVMEVSALVSWIPGITAYYDEKVNVFRILTN